MASSTRDILINILTKGDAAGAENVSKSLDQLAEKATAAGKAISTRVTVPVTALAAAALLVTANFDTAFREVTTLIDAPAESIASLRQDIRDMANDLGVDLVDSTKAAYNALSAGVPQDNLISFLESAAKTGIAGVASTNESVELLTGLMNTYDISFDQATEVSDKLFTTVKNGVTTIPKLASALGQVAPMASAAGVELDDLLGAMATITKQTGNTAQASTGLAAAITSLLNPTESLQEIYKTLNVEGGRQLIAQNGLAGALQKVKEQTGDSDQAFIKAVGSSEAYRAAVNLTGDNAQKAADDLDAMTQSAGASVAAFEKMDGGPKRAMDNLKASTTELLNVMGDQLVPLAIASADAIASIADSASQANPYLVGTGLAIGGIAAASGPALIAVGSLIRNYRILQTVAPGAAAAIAKGGAIAAAGIAGYALGTVLDEWLGLSDAIDKALAPRTMGRQGELDKELHTLRLQVRAIEDAADKDAARTALLKQRDTVRQLALFAHEAGERDVAAIYEQQIAKYDVMLGGLDNILARAQERLAAEREVEQSQEKAVQAQETIVQLTEAEIALRDSALSDIDTEIALLDAKLAGNDALVASLEDQKREQLIINQLKQQGVTLAEAEAKAQELVAKQRQLREKNDSPKASTTPTDDGNNDLRTRLDLLDQVGSKEQATKQLRAGVRAQEFIDLDGTRKTAYYENGSYLGDSDQFGKVGDAKTAPQNQNSAAQQSHPGQPADLTPVVSALDAIQIDDAAVLAAIGRFEQRLAQTISNLSSRIDEIGAN